MIHEVMILDHGSTDLAFIEYASTLKMWILSSLIVQIAVPGIFRNPVLSYVVNMAGIFAIAACVGVVESTMARFRLRKIPAILTGVFALLAFSIILMRLT